MTLPRRLALTLALALYLAAGGTIIYALVFGPRVWTLWVIVGLCSLGALAWVFEW